MDEAKKRVASRLRFEHPPVREVHLTLSFRPDGHIQGSHVAPLRERWGSTLPLVQERPPTPSDDDSGPTFLGLSGRWPLPYTRYHSVDEDHAVGFQADRFEVSWSFFADGHERYPGFDRLVGVLQEKFDEFCEVLKDAGISLALTGSECRYKNEIDGLSGPDLAVGVLTGWTGRTWDKLPAGGYLGVRLHACPDEEKHRCSSLVGVDSDGDDVPSLTIIVTRSSDGDEDDKLAGLYDAHEELNGIFVKYTPEYLHRKWGRIE